MYNKTRLLLTSFAQLHHKMFQCNFKLKRAQADRHMNTQTDEETGRQTNRMHEHFSTLFESVKNLGTELKIHFQSFQSIAHNVSEIFCVILYLKHLIVHLKEKFNFMTFGAIYVC